MKKNNSIITIALITFVATSLQAGDEYLQGLNNQQSKIIEKATAHSITLKTLQSMLEAAQTAQSYDLESALKIVIEKVKERTEILEQDANRVASQIDTLNKHFDKN